jgi:hypothetical protein
MVIVSSALTLSKETVATQIAIKNNMKRILKILIITSSFRETNVSEFLSRRRRKEYKSFLGLPNPDKPELKIEN